jgi:putative FmdB family regulatory protein
VRHAPPARLTEPLDVPVYEYRCTNCGHRTDILHGIMQPGPKFCPACGAEGTMRKTISAPSIHFKGSGWAKKDRASATKTKAAAKSDASPKAGGDGDAKAGGDGESKSTGDSSKSEGPTVPPPTAPKPAAPASSDAD